MHELSVEAFLGSKNLFEILIFDALVLTRTHCIVQSWSSPKKPSSTLRSAYHESRKIIKRFVKGTPLKRQLMLKVILLIHSWGL